jgi:hypothetical protein
VVAEVRRDVLEAAEVYANMTLLPGTRPRRSSRRPPEPSCSWLAQRGRGVSLDCCSALSARRARIMHAAPVVLPRGDRAIAQRHCGKSMTCRKAAPC